MEVLETIRNRVSLRKYANTPISPEHLEIIKEAIMRAPTAGNMMLYSVIKVEDQDLKDKLSETCDNQPFIAKAPLVLIFLADYQKWYDYYIQNNTGAYCERTGRSFTGPSEGNLMLAASDAIIAAQNAVIAAESLGIGSCYIGDIMERFEEHREILNLPDFVFPVAMLCLGYYPEDYKRTISSRFDEKFVFFENEYKRLSPEETNEMFSERAKLFNPKNTYGADNFAQIHYASKTAAEFSLEMGRSVREALKHWAGKNL